MSKKEPNDIHERAVRALEEHGHLFQQRCLGEIEYNCSNEFSLQSEEYPSSIGEEDTVIDFVLRSRGIPGFYLVFECKRANPDYVTWLFPLPLDARGQDNAKFLLTTMDRDGRFLTEEFDLLVSGPKYFVTAGLEISEKPANHGKKWRSRTDTIWSACQQVLTGVGGLILEQRERMLRIQQVQPISYLPVVVTTANLYTTEYRTFEVGLASGTLSDLSAAKTRNADWIVYDFPVREGLQITKPEYSAYRGWGPSDEYRRKFKVKSVAIVNSGSIARFLNQLNVTGG